MLVKLILRKNNINDDGCRVIAESLRMNRRLRWLEIDSDRITSQGFASFIPVVCNASSIKETLNSNHIIEYIATSNGLHDRVPEDLIELLKMNQGTDKKATAELKVLRCHFNDSVDNVAMLDTKTLPFLFQWFGRLNDGNEDTKHPNAFVLELIPSGVRGENGGTQGNWDGMGHSGMRRISPRPASSPHWRPGPSTRETAASFNFRGACLGPQRRSDEGTSRPLTISTRHLPPRRLGAAGSSSPLIRRTSRLSSAQLAASNLAVVLPERSLED
ncbi:hypothetical protein THAOC_23209 [Thalassiosira oceanica]|uniref:Uncharacterized protein n=1 Tax=Thalassiosira oceanica TaxID=159749 RepID=K0RSN7_THAOC|nr:hypothetical protein THAOC_23209 [Thalassiosira oceanica]|eukprot:EJK56823.1 hypothetical protein THAOC_23209 [Thalassiosira oceanica]